MSFSNYMENRALSLFRNQSGAIAAVYVKLHIGNPGEDGTSNAAAETTRKAVTFATESGGTINSNADVTWTNVAATEAISYVSLWDASSAGNCLGSGPLTQARSLTAGDSFTIPSGLLAISLD